MKQSFLQGCRNNTFWLLDAVTGGGIKNHLDEIRFINENISFSKELRDNKLTQLLEHARRTTQFYKNISSNNLLDFPVVNKSIIRERTNEFLSQSYNIDKLIISTTSGSTGTPFVMYQDKNKKDRNTADTAYFASRANYNLGDCLYYLKIWSELNKKTPVTSFMQNVVAVDVMKLNSDKIRNIIDRISNEQGKVGIIGYASALEQMAIYIEREKPILTKNNVSSIISISETLNITTREILNSYYGVMPVARYSSIECGIMGQQCPNISNEYHLNMASYYFEILDMEADFLVKPGTMGRIVVTDLFNYGMPFIRYDTGDVGSMQTEATCNFNTPVLTRLEGRKLDLIFNTSGELLNSLLVYKNMWKYTEVEQYQLIQTGKTDYTMRLCIKENIFHKEAQLITEFKEYLGADANFRVEYISEIPLLASGKRRKVVNEYYK